MTRSTEPSAMPGQDVLLLLVAGTESAQHFDAERIFAHAGPRNVRPCCAASTVVGTSTATW